MKLMKSNSNMLPNIWDDFFGNDFRSWFNDDYGFRSNVPAVNVKEDETSYGIEVAAPGLSKNDFKIELNNDVLTISAERKAEHEEKDNKGNYTRREFAYSTFSRSFTLPENEIKEEGIMANYENGVLRIVIPKLEEAKKRKAKQIAIA